MQRVKRFIFSPPYIKLNTLAMWEVVLLLLVSMAVIFYHSRKTLKQESIQNAEESLEATMLQVENIMRGVEQTTGNIYSDMLMHLSDLERMSTYSRELVKSNPYIYGCAIAFSPKATGTDRFMAYTHRKKYDSPELITSERYSSKPYMEQVWYLNATETGNIFWMVQKEKSMEDEVPLLIYCIPVRYSADECVGVIAVEVSMDLFSEVVLGTKVSSNSYCMLLDKDGSYIIHPDHKKLMGQTVFTTINEDADPSMHQAAEAMLSGETGHCFFRSDGEEYELFYRPFLRSNTTGRSLYKLDWSIGLVYPAKDIADPYKNLIIHVLYITLGTLLVFFFLCRIVFRAQLSPLRKLTALAEDIADGHFDEEIPKTRRQDEMGEFQRHFRQMQEVLKAQIAEQEQLTVTMQERREMLRHTYAQIEDTRQLKRNLLNKVTNQMLPPSASIRKSVNNLCDNYETISPEEARREVDNIKQQRDTILEMLDEFLNPSDNEVRKEDSHE